MSDPDLPSFGSGCVWGFKAAEKFIKIMHFCKKLKLSGGLKPDTACLEVNVGLEIRRKTGHVCAQ